MALQKDEIVAAIDVGSNALRMQIAEIKGNGKTHVLEDVRKAVTIGKDTFTYGKVRISTIYEVCEILAGYLKLIKEYRIKTYRAVTTSGVREAANRDYVLDQIHQKTGLTVEIINNAEERFLTYKAIQDKLDHYEEIQEKGTVIVDIGSGGVELSLYKGSLQFTEYIKVGSLRLREVLADLERRTLDFPDIMEQFIESKIYLLQPIIANYHIQNFIGLGGEMKTISSLCSKNVSRDETRKIHRTDLKQLLEHLRSMTVDHIIKEFKVSQERAEILLPSVIIFLQFLEMTEAEVIYAPMVSLRDGLVADMVDHKYETLRDEKFQQDIISSVRCMGAKYQYDKIHAVCIEQMAVSIFDQTRKLHGLSERARFYLQIAAILHDIGKFISINRHDENSFEIIRSSDIMGLSNRELMLLAIMVRYHSEEIPTIEHYSYRDLDEKDRVMVSKLAAILQIADSLDITHHQKINEIKVTFEDGHIIFRVNTNEDLLLEEWTFNSRIQFFEEVFGVRPILKSKGRIS